MSVRLTVLCVVPLDDNEKNLWRGWEKKGKEMLQKSKIALLPTVFTDSRNLPGEGVENDFGTTEEDQLVRGLVASRCVDPCDDRVQTTFARAARGRGSTSSCRASHTQPGHSGSMRWSSPLFPEPFAPRFSISSQLFAVLTLRCVIGRTRDRPESPSSSPAGRSKSAASVYLEGLVVRPQSGVAVATRRRDVELVGVGEQRLPPGAEAVAVEPSNSGCQQPRLAEPWIVDSEVVGDLVDHDTVPR